MNINKLSNTLSKMGIFLNINNLIVDIFVIKDKLSNILNRMKISKNINNLLENTFVIEKSNKILNNFKNKSEVFGKSKKYILGANLFSNLDYFENFNFWNTWFAYQNIVSISIVFLAILFFGLFLYQDPRNIRLLNYCAFFLIFISILVNSWDSFIIEPSKSLDKESQDNLKNGLNDFFNKIYTNIDSESFSSQYNRFIETLKSDPNYNSFLREPYPDDECIGCNKHNLRKGWIHRFWKFFGYDTLKDYECFLCDHVQKRHYALLREAENFLRKGTHIFGKNTYVNYYDRIFDGKSNALPDLAKERSETLEMIQSILRKRFDDSRLFNSLYTYNLNKVYKDGIHINNRLLTSYGNDPSLGYTHEYSDYPNILFYYQDSKGLFMSLIPYMLDSLFLYKQYYAQISKDTDFSDIMMENKMLIESFLEMEDLINMSIIVERLRDVSQIFLFLEHIENDTMENLMNDDEEWEMPTKMISTVPDYMFNWDRVAYNPEETDTETDILIFLNFYDFYINGVLTFDKFESETDAFYNWAMKSTGNRHYKSWILGEKGERWNLYQEFSEFNKILEKIKFKETPPSQIDIIKRLISMEYMNLFEMITMITICIFLFGIADVFYIKENSSMEYGLLIILIQISAMLAINSENFMEIVLALECISLCSYILVGYERRNKFSAQAGIQYLILSSVVSVLLILGISIIYKCYGSFYKNHIEMLLQYDSTNVYSNWNLSQKISNLIFLEFTNLIEDWYWLIEDLGKLSNWLFTTENIDYTFLIKKKNFELQKIRIYNPYNSVLNYDTLFLQESIKNNYSWVNSNDVLLLNNSDKVIFYYNYIFVSVYIACLLILINFLFKITAAPFHIWAPAIYGKAPIASVTFLSIFSKITILFLIIYLLTSTFYMLNDLWEPLLIFCSVLSVICGALGALSERVIKRFFVYSSMGHIGFILVGIAVHSIAGITAAINYLIVYIITSFIVWFIIMLLARQLTHLNHFKILKTNDIIAFIFTVVMFSMSGIPPLGGFFVKFEILHCLFNSAIYWVAFIFLILTVITFFYYLRIIKLIYFENPKIFVKLKYIDDNKLRFITFAWHFLVLFTFLMQPPVIYIISSVVKTFF